MNTASPVTCPKCGYTRTAADTAPAWQCPSCGIAYNKFHAAAAPLAPAGAAPGPAPDGAAAQQDKRERFATAEDGRDGSCGPVYVGLLFTGIFVPGSWIWLLVLPLLACSSFYYWVRAYRRQRMVEDVPTSKISNAAQGYAELRGTVAPAPAGAVKAALTHQPCVWYTYSIDEDESGGHTRTIESGTVGVPFLIRDETGECLVNPHGADLLCEMCERWDEGQRHYSEWSIRVGDPIYAIGRFSTHAVPPAGDLAIQTDAVLRSWLADPKGFFIRFDADRNGKIAALELAKAREAARGEALQRNAAKAAELNTLVAPEDGRPFVLMNMVEGGVDKRFRQLTVVHLCIFFIALGFLTYNLL